MLCLCIHTASWSNVVDMETKLHEPFCSAQPWDEWLALLLDGCATREVTQDPRFWASLGTGLALAVWRKVLYLWWQSNYLRQPESSHFIIMNMIKIHRFIVHIMRYYLYGRHPVMYKYIYIYTHMYISANNLDFMLCILCFISHILTS